MKHHIAIAALLVLASCVEESGPREHVGPRTADLPKLAGDACQSVDECRQVAEACNGHAVCELAMEAETLDDRTGEATNLVAQIIERGS